MSGTYKQKEFGVDQEENTLLTKGETNCDVEVLEEFPLSHSHSCNKSYKTFDSSITVGAAPVRLSPGWEGTGRPEDELNFKGVTTEQLDLETNPPKDRWNLVLLIFILHGIGALLPWNMFINANSYFVEFKMNNTRSILNVTHLNSSTNTNYVNSTVNLLNGYTGNSTQAHIGPTGINYAEHFLAYLSFAAQIPNLLFNWLNLFVQLGENLTTRIVWGILIEVLMFLLTVILAMVDSSSWPGLFFWITMVSVVILNTANGIYQNSVYGMAAKLPNKYTGMVILGSNISGTFTSVLNIISQAMAPSKRTAAIYYFITALLVLLACFDTYFALPLNRFYRYHELQHEKKTSKKKLNGSSRGRSSKPLYWEVFKQCKLQCFNVFFVFFVTLSLFPSVQSKIKKSDKNFIIPDDYYSSVMCFLTFNTTAMLGSLLASFIQWPGKKWITIPIILRALFIPLFLLCNYYPDSNPNTRLWPVLINNDYVYFVLSILMGLTNGYFSSITMMYCSTTVDPQYAATAGMFGAAFLITGIFTGILFTMVLPIFVTITF